MKATHEVVWYNKGDGYTYSVRADYITAMALYEALKVSKVVRKVTIERIGAR